MTAKPDALVVVETAAERFHRQWSTGEWEGPGQFDWLTLRYPCGRHKNVGSCACSNQSTRGLPPWSQVMASEPERARP